MSLEKVQIEGLESWENVELYDDTPPSARQVSFKVASEEMPFLSEKAGHTIRQNFIHVTVVKDLGRTVFTRRVRDKVEFDEGTKKWKVAKLAIGDTSDIRKFTPEWNNFMRGLTDFYEGTPLDVLFKNDPSREEMYKVHKIFTVEQLAGMGYSDAQLLGMGVSDDIQRAKQFLEKVAASAPNIATLTRLAEQDKIIEEQTKKMAEYEAKLVALLDSELTVPKKGRTGRPAAKKNTDLT